jgi:hypothetical protein
MLDFELGKSCHIDLSYLFLEKNIAALGVLAAGEGAI